MLKKACVALAFSAAMVSGAAHAQEEERWSGVYVGVHGAFADGTVEDRSGRGLGKQDIDGWLGGAQVGFNKQSGNFLFGVEGDVTFGKNRNNWIANPNSDSLNENFYGDDRVRTSGTVRARAGYASDNALVYLTGGLALADTRHGVGCRGSSQVVLARCANSDEAGANFYTTDSKTRLGYVLGGGVELAVNQNISIKGEYNYVDYGKTDLTFVDSRFPNASGDRSYKLKTNLYKVGVNFGF